MPDKVTRRVVAEQAKTEQERLEIVLNQGLDEWLRAHIVGLLRNVSAQPDDLTAIDRAMNGVRYAVQIWKRSRTQIAALPDE